MSRTHRVLTLLFLLLLSLCAVVVRSDGEHPSSCHNPLFSSPLSLLNHTSLHYNEQPQPCSSCGLCSNIAASQPSCCSEHTEHQMRGIIDALMGFRHRLTSAAPSLLLHSLLFHQGLLAMPNSSFSPLSLTQQSLLHRYSDLLTPILAGAGDCIDSVITYTQGLLCYSCDPHSAEYLQADGSLRLHWEMCANTQVNCRDTLGRLVAAVPSLLDLFIAFLLATPNLSQTAAATLDRAMFVRSLAQQPSTEGFCTSSYLAVLSGGYRRFDSCDDAMCSLLLRGLDWDVLSWLQVANDTQPSIHVPGMRAGTEPPPMSMPGGAAEQHGGMHSHSVGGSRTLMSLAASDSAQAEREAAGRGKTTLRLLSASPLSSLLPAAASLRFHVMHGDDMKQAVNASTPHVPTTNSIPLNTMPAPPASLNLDASFHPNGRLSSTAWCELSDAPCFPVWSVGCASLEAAGILLCPSGEERTAWESKKSFLLVVAAAAAGVSLLVLVLWTLWHRGAGDNGLSGKKRSKKRGRRALRGGKGTQTEAEDAEESMILSP